MYHCHSHEVKINVLADQILHPPSGPLPNTVVDFWRLVWQEKIQTIAMLTNVMEGKQKQCEPYWPESGSKEFGPFMITLIEKQVFADYTIRTLHLVVSEDHSLILHTFLSLFL